MQFHYYTLLQLANYLNQKFKGCRLVSCFSQNKNELMIDMGKGLLRVGCHTPLTYCVPIEDFAKAGKNVVDLFEWLYFLDFVGARVVPFERILVLEFAQNHQLVLKLHGIQANVIALKDGEVIEMLNNDIEKDETYQEEAGLYDVDKIELLKELVTQDEKYLLYHLRQISMIYDKYFAQRMLQLIEKGKTTFEAFEQTLQEAQADVYYIFKDKSGIHFQLFPLENEAVEVKEIAQALTFFLKCYHQYSGYYLLHHKISKEIATPFRNLQKTYHSYRESIQKLKEERSAEEIGHLLMANLHLIQPEMQSITVEDFYSENQPITIKLKEDLSPSENAAFYYGKHKDRKTKLAYMEKEILLIEDKVLSAEEKMETFYALPQPENLTLTADGLPYQALKTLKKWEKTEVPSKKQKPPFRMFEKDGWQIFIGRNSENNDQLSFKFANKEDMWLHVKDVTGSHVILRHKAGQKFPKNVLEYAAGLAAWFSKRRNEGLVPVIFTPRKFIRKRKGDAAGQVAISKEEVMMIEPIKG